VLTVRIRQVIYRSCARHLGRLRLMLSASEFTRWASPEKARRLGRSAARRCSTEGQEHAAQRRKVAGNLTVGGTPSAGRSQPGQRWLAVAVAGGAGDVPRVHVRCPKQSTYRGNRILSRGHFMGRVAKWCCTRCREFSASWRRAGASPDAGTGNGGDRRDTADGRAGIRQSCVAGSSSGSLSKCWTTWAAGEVAAPT